MLKQEVNGHRPTRPFVVFVVVDVTGREEEEEIVDMVCK
jgi:hypothetical protein